MQTHFCPKMILSKLTAKYRQNDPKWLILDPKMPQKPKMAILPLTQVIFKKNHLCKA